MFGAPVTGPKLTTLPPTCRWRCGVARVQHEALGRMRELRFDELAPEPHHLRGLVHQRAGAAVHLARRDAADLEARFLQHAERGLQDALDLLGGQDLERRPRIVQARQRLERRAGRARGAPAFTAAGRCRCIRHGFALATWRAGARHSTQGARGARLPGHHAL